MTPQALSRAPNPALTPLPPVTPIVNTSLSELRAARSAESGGGITSSKGASKSSKDDDDRTTTELVTEAISKGLKQERTLRAKVMANKESTLWWLLKQIKALLIKFGISNLTKWQITTILLGTYFLWPKLKPSMRLLLHRVHLQVLSARDSFMSKVAAHLIGLTTTGVTFAIASRTNTNTDEDPEPSAAPTGEPTAEISSRSSTPLSPIPESPASRRAAMLNVETYVETGTDFDNESVPPLEEPSPEADKPEADAASSPSTTVSQWQSNVKPTENGGAAVQDAQAVQVQPEVPVPSESISMDTVKLAVPMNVSRKITLKFTDAQRAVMFNTSAGIPNDAMLFDNGATLNCIKTDAGRLVGSFIENADGDISVGDESSSLASNGSYLHALTFTDADGKKIDTLYRFDDTRNAICNIFSEPSEVYENGGSFSFNNGGRVWTTTDNCSMRLHMTPNHLAWAKVTPIQDKSTIRALLERSKHNLTVSIPRRIATPSPKLISIVDGALDTGVAVERTVEETTAEIDAIATSINMMPLVDPTFTGFIPGEPMFEGESVTAACKRQPTVVSSSTSPFFTVQPPCDKDLNYIMDDLYKEHKWGSIDSDDSNGDYDDMPECINDSSASSGDDEHTARHSIARKKKLVLQVSGAKQVCISSAGDDNESMGKLFVSNLKTATSKLSESTNTYALRLAENAAELKIAMLRTCTKYAKYLDESTACNSHRAPDGTDQSRNRWQRCNICGKCIQRQEGQVHCSAMARHG